MSTMAKYAATAALAILFLGAGPARALPPLLEVAPVQRATAGKPSQWTLALRTQSWSIEWLDRVSVEDGRIVLRLDAYRSTFPGGNDYTDGFAFELPALPAGTYPVVLLARFPYGTNPVHQYSEQASTILTVHPALDVFLEAGETARTSRLRLAGSGTDIVFTGKPVLAGKTIRAEVMLVPCNITCPPPPSAWEYVSEDFGPVAAGTYRVELIDREAVHPAPRFLWRGELQALDAPVIVEGNRFEVSIELDAPLTQRPRLVQPPSLDSALFYFFDPANWEAMVKVLDGCVFNGHFWVFAAASTDVGYTLRVKDLLEGEVKEYRHPAGTPAPALADTLAFSCD